MDYEINDMGKQYRYSLAEEEVKKCLSAEEWWFERFGDDPLWGESARLK